MANALVKELSQLRLVWIAILCPGNLFQIFLSHIFCSSPHIGHWVFIKNYSVSEWHSGIQLHSDINYSDRSLFRRVKYVKCLLSDILSPCYQLICHLVNHSCVHNTSFPRLCVPTMHHDNEHTPWRNIAKKETKLPTVISYFAVTCVNDRHSNQSRNFI